MDKTAGSLLCYAYIFRSEKGSPVGTDISPVGMLRPDIGSQKTLWVFHETG